MTLRFSKAIQFTASSIIILFLGACNNPKLTITEIKTIPYPSGSSAACSGNKIFLTGDDARYILVTDMDLNKTDSIIVSAPGVPRIPKSEKHDFEASTLIGKNKTALLVLGSGSELPERGKGLIVNVETKDTQQVDLSPLYERLKKAGLKELNIEGAAYVQGSILLSNRGHQGSPHNHLIFLPDNFWLQQDSVEFSIARLGFKSGDVFNGVSGLDYSFLEDKLFVSLSTELTSSTTADGAIGKSYLWVFDNIIRYRGYEGINPALIIDLEKEDKRFKGHKIESVAILPGKGEPELILISDNDDGRTTIFKVVLHLKK